MGIVVDSREVPDFKERRAYAQMAGEILEVLPDMDAADIHINQLFNSIPPEFRSRYLISNTEEAEETKALLVSPTVTVESEEVKCDVE